MNRKNTAPALAALQKTYIFSLTTEKTIITTIIIALSAILPTQK
jgi:hypothetical protein